MTAFVDITETATAVAEGFARAIAFTGVDCTALGNAEAEARAVARSRATATAYAEAILQGVVSVETCAGCTASVNFLNSAVAEVFLEATALSETMVRSL